MRTLDGIAAPLTGQAKVKTTKRKLYELHSWLGFHLAFLMTLVLLTGTIAVIANEIDWLLQADMRVTPDGSLVSWGELEAAARSAAPDHLLASLAVGEGDHFAYRASMLTADGRRYFLHLNQWTGEVTGTTGALTVQRFFRDLHRYLFMPAWAGLPIVCSMALVLAVSLYSGLKTTGRIATVAKRVRSGKGVRVLIGDLHRVAGIWSSWFFMLIILTACWYLFEFGVAVAGERLEPDRPGLSEQRLVEIGDVRRLLPASELVVRAEAAFPGWRPTQLLYPRNPQQALTILGRSDDLLVRSRANRVFLDPVDGSIIKVQKSAEIGVVAYLNELADPLHFGSFGFLASKLIWFVFGCAMTGLSCTGVWLTCRRLKSFSVSRQQLYSLPIFLAATLSGCFYVDRYAPTEESGSPLARAAADFNGLGVSSVWRAGQASDKQLVEVEVSHAQGTPLVRGAWVINGRGERQAMTSMMATSQTFLRTLIPVAMSHNQDALLVEIELMSGSRLRQTLSREP